MTTYQVLRFYQDAPLLNREVIATGLTLEQAQAHCQSPETSSATATSDVAQQRTKAHGAWFDGYEEER